MTRRIAILPTGDWAEVSKTIGDVEYVTLNERQFDEVCDGATQNTILTLSDGMTSAEIDSALGIRASAPAATDISDRAWRFALNECLSSYDVTKTPQEILSDVEAMTDDIVVWEPFEDYDGDWVAETITGLAKQAQDLINKAGSV